MTNEPIPNMTEIISELFSPFSFQSVTLFGSVVNGRFHEHSDIDIAVNTGRDFSLRDMGTLQTLKEELAQKTRTPVDLLVTNYMTLDDAITQAIEREGVVIYEKG